MKGPGWNRRFWASTRGRIVSLLRRGTSTVNEMAEALSLTDNAIRAHLAVLERDGLVQVSGTRPGTRRPTSTYALTPEAEQLFPKIYGPVLRHLVEVLSERLPARKVDEIVRDAGQRMAENQRLAVTGKGLRERIRQTVAVLREWGGMAELEETNGRAAIRCFDCPVAVAAAGHPEICRLVETVVASLVRAPVRQHCQTEPVPQCYFEIGGNGAAR
jgi:predicted ArsR family transcriptional regulator